MPSSPNIFLHLFGSCLGPGANNKCHKCFQQKSVPRMRRDVASSASTHAGPLPFLIAACQLTGVILLQMQVFQYCTLRFTVEVLAWKCHDRVKWACATSLTPEGSTALSLPSPTNISPDAVETQPWDCYGPNVGVAIAGKVQTTSARPEPRQPGSVRPEPHQPTSARPESHQASSARPESHQPSSAGTESHQPSSSRPESHQPVSAPENPHATRAGLETHHPSSAGPEPHQPTSAQAESHQPPSAGPESHPEPSEATSAGQNADATAAVAPAETSFTASEEEVGL